MSSSLDAIIGILNQDPSLDLNRLAELVEHRKIELTYGRTFTQIVGAENIFKLPVVDAQELNLRSEDKYYQNTTKPSHMKDKSAVRGTNGRNCPFVAIKIDVLVAETRQLVAKVVEVVFKRYGNSGDGSFGKIHENNYVTTLSTVTEEGESHPSYLYSQSGMSESQIQAVRDLLEGKEIGAPCSKHHRIRMAKD